MEEDKIQKEIIDIELLNKIHRMSKIPTAEELLQQYHTWSAQDSPDTMTTVIEKQDCLEAMIQFAKLHVSAALAAAANMGKETWDWTTEECNFIIEDTYPESNIQ